MPHEMAPPQPTPDELAQRLLAEHANTEIQFHGKTMAFGQFVQLRAALCPVKPGELGATSDTEFMVNVLTDSQVELSEEYHSYKRQPEIDKPVTSSADNELTKKTETISKKEPVKKDESIAVVSNSSQALHEKPEIEVKPSPKLHPEIMARIVKLETESAITEPVVDTLKLVAKRVKAESVTETPSAILTKPKTETTVNIVTVQEIIPKSVEEINPVLMPISEVLIDDAGLETTVAQADSELVQVMNYMSEEITHVPMSESEIETSEVATEGAVIIAEAIAVEPFETEFTVMPELSEVYEAVEKTPAVAVAEFMMHVLPAVTQEVYESVQEMEPEAAAEVAGQIESVIIVADRLHVLVLEGNTDGEEAKQIEAYLKREYEQLLVAVGIKPTDKILNDFILYIYSAEYQIREAINVKELETIDEGTHEKKLFDEQGVFSRAHAASLNLSRRLDKSIGRLVVNYFS